MSVRITRRGLYQSLRERSPEVLAKGGEAPVTLKLLADALIETGVIVESVSSQSDGDGMKCSSCGAAWPSVQYQAKVRGLRATLEKEGWALALFCRNCADQGPAKGLAP